MEIPILQDFTIELLSHLMDSFDGIIFLGGGNIDSLWYGEQPLVKQSIETELRNRFERALFLAAKEKSTDFRDLQMNPAN